MENQSNYASLWLDYIKTLGPILVGLVAVYYSYRINKATLQAKYHEDEKKELFKKLNEFYGPFKQLTERNNMLFRLFTRNKEEHYKTLPALLEGEKFEDNDKELLDQIIEIDGQISKLIIEKSGLIDDQEMSSLLAKAATHFNVITLAYKGQLRGEAPRFDDYLYPRELNGKIDEQIEMIKKRLEELNKA